MLSKLRLAAVVALSLAGGTAAQAQQAPAPTFPQQQPTYQQPPAFQQTLPGFMQQVPPTFQQQAPTFYQQVPVFQTNFTTQQALSIPIIVGIDSNGMPIMGVPRVQVPLIQQSYAYRRTPTSPAPGFPPARPSYPQGWSPGTPAQYGQNPFPGWQPYGPVPR